MFLLFFSLGSSRSGFGWKLVLLPFCCFVISPLPLCVHLCVSLPCVFTAVESLYAALKSIDRLDIVNMLEGQPPQPTRQGSRDLSRRRHNDREHLSPGMTNGEFRFPNPTVQPPPEHLFCLDLRILLLNVSDYFLKPPESKVSVCSVDRCVDSVTFFFYCLQCCFR